MTGDLSLREASPEPMRAGPQVLQKVSVLAAKAALSTIPWAAFVFDLGQSAVDFANARLMDRLLDGMGDRIDRLEGGARERLKADEIYQLSAQAAIRRMLTKTNPRMADALSRAVVGLGVLDNEPAEKMQIVRGLEVLTEPSLHLLQTIYRVEKNMLTSTETELIKGNDPKNSDFFNILINESMQLLSWVGPTADLQRTGMIEDPPEGGMFAEALEAPRYDTGAFRVMLIGRQVVQLCFDDLTVPAFGAFADIP